MTLSLVVNDDNRGNVSCEKEMLQEFKISLLILYVGWRSLLCHVKEI